MCKVSFTDSLYLTKMATEQTTEEVKRYRYHDIHKAFTPRGYQIEILEAAKKGNVIACMGTGTGKTFIAVLLIQENANEVRLPFSKGGKRIFFLVPTVPLVLQQKKAIQNHTDLKVKGYYSGIHVNSWTKELKSTEVLVMTAEIFRMIIDHAFIPLNKIKLLIIDECHLAQKEHPYKQIMERFVNIKSSEMPKIFGLSASLLKGKVKPVQLEKSLQELEKILRSIIITAVDTNDLKVYGTDPKEISVYYQVLEFASSGLKTEILDFSSELKLEKSEFDRNDEFFSKNEIFFDKPLRCLNSLLVILENLGFWGVHTAAKIYLKDVIFMCDHPFSEKYQHILKKVKKFLIKLIKKCQILLWENGSHVTHKLKTLQAIFLSIKQRNLNGTSSSSDTTFECDIEKYFPNIKQICEYLNVSDINMCSIVFVEQKITAYVLYKWLIDMKKKCPSFAFLKPEFIAGHGRADLIETAMSLSKQKKILSRFRKKKCNLLIATSILEEGVDIQQCNLVIRFDLPSDFCSYIQSKGRARAKNSMYILMVPQHPATVSEFLQNMSDFKTIEKVLLVRCHNRVMPSEEEISDHMADSLIPAFMPYGPQGPRITMSSSIALINRYCARHHQTSDISTKSEPQWDIKVVDPDSNEIQYVCMLHLQINSYLKQTIIGENMKQKRLAKMSAALKACKLLYEIGELNEHLMPVTCSVDKALVEELGLIKNNIDEILPEKNRRRQLYEKHMPIFLKNSRPASGIPCYLHIFKMDLTEPLPKCLNPLNRPLFNPMATSRNVALLTSKIWPPVNPFPLFTKSGKILVKVKALKNTIILSSEELKKVEEFHKFVFSDALWLDKNKGFSPACSKFSAYIVPVNKVETANYDIDWSFIDATKAHPYNDQKHKTLAVDRTHFDEELFKDSVLIRFYKIAEWKNACPSFHHVINILYSMSPESKLDESSGITFKDYYKAKYNIRILNDKQPLVETVRSGVGNFWKPLYISLKDTYKDVPQVRRSKQNQKHHNEYLVPELCIIHPFPSSFFNKVIYLPTMLFRLQCLLLAEEIRQNVASEACVGSLHLRHIWPEFNLEKSDKVLKEKLHKKGQIKAYVASNAFVPRDVIKTHEKIISFEAKVELLDHPGPNPSLILQALTSKSTADEFDSECLKTIGNSFLRYVLSVKTYHKYPNYDAGKLSKLRSGLTKTSSLCHAAKKKNLAEYLICTCFNYNTTWLPPCYIVNEVMSQKSSSKKARRKKNSNENTIVIHQYFTKQLISDDCIADTVKALIGVYLLSCGQQGALQFMNWLGLNPLTKNVDISDKDFISWPPVTPDPLITSEMSSEFLQQRLSHLTSGFDRFEDIIKYKFNNVAYLLQAFTHCSYSYNEITDCYQKLRFLGSTVLDYIITRQLFEDCNDHFSEILSDHRSTLISDEFFASLAVRYKYHEFLKMLSPWYFKLLNCYLELLQKSDAFKFFEKYGYYQEVNCSELERDKVPQVLVDVFESVAGAIYLDSGSSLDIVWKIYYPMIVSTMSFLKEHIQSYT